jgi:CheY-like chemotaxis protein
MGVIDEIDPPIDFLTVQNDRYTNLLLNGKEMEVTKQILVCDDNEFIRETLRVFLSDNPDFELDFAVDGQDALKKISHQKYDLIIMDIQMPFFSGVEIIRMLREVNKDTTPIIVLTGHLTDEVLKNNLEKNAVECILTKPFSPAILMDKMAEIFNAHVTL